MPTQNAINNSIVDNDFSVQMGDIFVLDGVINIGAISPINPLALSIEQSLTSDLGISIQNTSTNSSAGVIIECIGEDGAADINTVYTVDGLQSYATGIDNDDNDTFKITTGATPSTGITILEGESGGNVILGSTGLSTSTLIQSGSGDVDIESTGNIGLGTAIFNSDIDIGLGGQRSITIGNTNTNTEVDIVIGSNNFSLSSSSGIIMDAQEDGQCTYPLQPAFLANVGASQANVTGDSTAYIVLFPNEVFDQGGDFSSPTFTAPVTGRYCLTVFIFLQDVTSSHTTGFMQMITSNRNYLVAACNPANMVDSTTFEQLTLMGSCFADMDAADTATIQIDIENGAKVIDIVNGGATNLRSYFSGWLVA